MRPVQTALAFFLAITLAGFRIVGALAYARRGPIIQEKLVPRGSFHGVLGRLKKEPADRLASGALPVTVARSTSAITDPKDCGDTDMNGDPSPSQESALLSLDKRVDEACDRFESAWRAGQRPRIEEYVAQASLSERLELLSQLLALEIELRRTGNEKPTTEEYTLRFPGHDEVIRAILQVHRALPKRHA
jgi:hypothetical protein